MTDEEIGSALADLGLPKYRTTQICGWVRRGINDFSEMTDIPKGLRATLSERFFLTSVTTVRRLVSAIDGTVK